MKRHFPWKKKSTHNKIDKCTGRGNYTSGANRQIVFRTEKDAETYTLGDKEKRI